MTEFSFLSELIL